MSGERKDNAGVIAPPPLIYAAGLGAGLALERIAPLRLPGGMWPKAAGMGLGLAALGLAVWGAMTLRCAGTAVDPRRGTQAIVTGGPYRLTRNPVYLSLALLLAGGALALGTGWGLAMLAPVLWVVQRGVIVREEMYLEGKFGDLYVEYKKRTRRWL